MQRNDKKKICVVVSSLADGGAERSSAILTKILDSLGHDVFIVSVLPNVDFEYSGTLLNLGELKNSDNSPFGRLKRFMVFLNHLKKNNFDFVIENRSRNSFLREIVISGFVYNPKKTIYCVRSYHIRNYFIRPNWLSKMLYKSAFAIVANAKEMAEAVENKYNFENVHTIYNAVNPNNEKVELEPEKFILYYGRIEDKVKNLKLLIRSYKTSNLSKQQIKLKILGSGPDLSQIKEFSKSLGLGENILFVEYDPIPEKHIKHALFTILTSKFEGFPRVLLESLSCGTPVVSVDCKSGPSEIVIHEHNGLLVPNNNVIALSNAMNRMLEDKNLYLHCKLNARPSVEKFSIDNIARQWQTLLNKEQA